MSDETPSPDNAMTYATLLALVLQHGLPTALEIAELFRNKREDEKVTEEDWQRLEAISVKTYKDYAPPIPDDN